MNKNTTITETLILRNEKGGGPILSKEGVMTFANNQKSEEDAAFITPGNRSCVLLGFFSE